MIIAVDFDGTIVSSDRPYNDIYSPLIFLPGAREGLRSLKRAGHTLVLWSGRTNRALIYNPEFDPLWVEGMPWPSDAARMLHADRLRQMLRFVAEELPGVFDAIDDGRQGKLEADLYIDDRGIGADINWKAIAATYGEL